MFFMPLVKLILKIAYHKIVLKFSLLLVEVATAGKPPFRIEGAQR